MKTVTHVALLTAGWLLLLVASGSAVCCVLSQFPTDAHRIKATRQQMEALLRDPPLYTDVIRDAWGNRMGVLITNEAIDIRSAGPDGLILTDDDLILRRAL